MDLSADYHEALEVYPGARLRALRLSLEISQRQLAELSGVDQSVICRLERGGDALWSTWRRLFAGLGYYAVLSPAHEDEGDTLVEDGQRLRRDRMEAGRRARWG